MKVRLLLTRVKTSTLFYSTLPLGGFVLGKVGEMT